MPVSFRSVVRAVSALAVAPALAAFAGLVGCGPLPEEQGDPQFPRGEVIGAPGTPESERAAALDVNGLSGVPYAQGGVQVGPEDPSNVVGGELPGGSDGYADTDPSALTDFHAALDPYGQWVEDPTYGTLWEPSAGAVGEDFAPYESAGHWSYGSDYVWVSDYSWGWAPFHYGRWVYATNGWGWIPGRQYAGAWTTWRTGYGAYGGYVGWAPLPPTYFWRGGVALGIGAVPPAAYGFCQTNNLFASNLSGRMVGGPQVAALGQNSRPYVGAVPVVGHGAIGGNYGSTAGAGRTLAHPEVAGPSPQSMNIAARQVVRPPTNNAGLARAGQFARPSTAMALGGHAPAGWSASHATGGVVSGRTGRSIGSSPGMAAYGSGYGGIRETRTLGSWNGERSSFARPYSLSPHDSGAFHGPSAFGPSGTHFGHGVPAAPQYHPPQYGGGYHPSSSGGGGGHFGGHGGGGGRGGGGHR